MKRWFSWKRVTAGVILLVIVAGIALPHFLTLETYRPKILEQLEEATGRRITIGALHAWLLPPSVTGDDIVLFERDAPYRPFLTAQRVRLRLRMEPLLEGKIQIHTAAIERPRVILYTDAPMGVRDFKSSGTGSNRKSSLRCLIHQGKIELGGPLFGETIRWAIDNVEAEVDGAERNMILTARPSFLGSSARLNVTLNPGTEKPMSAELKKANLDTVFSVLGSTQEALWRGARLDAHVEAIGPAMNRFVLHIDRLSVPSIPDAFLRGTVQISTASMQGTLQFEGLASSMTVKGRWSKRWNGWDASGQVERYSPEIVHLLLDNRWVQALRGPGSVAITASQRGTQPCRYTLSGSSFTFSGTRLAVPAWSATEDGSQFVVSVDARTPDEEGEVAVRWTQTSAGSSGNVQVSLSSVTVGDVLEVFAVHPEKPIGVEPWMIQDGYYEGPVAPGGRVLINQVSLVLQNLKVAATGQLDLSADPVRAHFVGELTNVDLKPVLESFWKNTRVSGTSVTNFNLQFNSGPHWLESLDGQVNFQSHEGFIKAGKVLFRIAGILNLPQLLNPTGRAKTTAAGFPYKTASAEIEVNHGVFNSQDLKIRTANMNIGVKGQVNLPVKTIDARIDFQFLNIVKDTLNQIPLVKRVLSKDTGLIQIPVRVRGPLDDPNID